MPHKTIAEILDWQEGMDLLKIPDGPWTHYNNMTMNSMLYALCNGQKPIPVLLRGTVEPKPRVTLFHFRDGSLGYFDHSMDDWSVGKRERYVPFRSVLSAKPTPEFTAKLVADHTI